MRDLASSYCTENLIVGEEQYEQLGGQEPAPITASAHLRDFVF